MRLSLLHVAVFLVIAANLLSTFFVLHETSLALSPTTGKASDQGLIQFCLNTQPSLTVPCEQGLSQDQPYSCTLNGTDADGDALTFSAAPVAPDTELLFILSNSSFSFTPNSSQIGYHEMLFTANDSSPCSNAAVTVSFNLSIANVNDAPTLLSSLPAVALSKNVPSSPFSLDDYFSDPDGDELVYRAVSSSSSVVVSIANDSRVTFLSSGCGAAFVRFIANDSSLETQSNLITVTTACPATPSSPSGPGGGGAGGGGGALLPCDVNFSCTAWSACFPGGERVQSCHDLANCSDDVELREPCDGAEQASLEVCRENWYCRSWGPCAVSGRQLRSCQDLAGCGTLRFRPPLERACAYAPGCFNGVMDQDELGVDCGGTCGPCLRTQQPSVLGPSSTFLMLLVLLLLSALLALALLYREQMEEGVLLLRWMATKGSVRTVLLDQSEKRVLLERLGNLPDGAPRQRLAAALRLSLGFALKVPAKASVSERADALARLEVPSAVYAFLATASERIAMLESGDPDLLEIATWREELRLLVWMTSDAEPVKRSITLPVTMAMSFREEIRARTLNCVSALNRLDLAAAKHEYLAILRAYNELDAVDRAELYEELHRLYLAIGYVQQRKDG